MKELSIEQKAEAYDEAIKRIQSYVVDEYGYTRIKVVNVFPELKESEDENIIKHDIIEFIKRNKSPFAPVPSDITLDKWIAWLEKQGNVDKKLIQYRDYLVSETERWHKAGSDKTNSAIGKQDCTGHANAFISARSEFEEVFNWDDLIEKQGEKPQGKSIIEAWKDMRLEVYQQASGNRHEPNCSDDNTKMFSVNDIDEIIEKITEQYKEK